MDLRRNHRKSNKMNFAKKHDFCRNLRKYTREYCEVTSIQGLRFIAEKRSLVEKIWWIVIVLVALGGCAYMIYEVVHKYVNSPVVVSFATRETPIYEIPFPAVTICPESKCARSKFNYTDAFIKHVFNHETLSEEDLKSFHYMSLLCDEERMNISTQIKNKTVDEDFFAYIDKYKPNRLMVCHFMNEYNGMTEKNCDEILTPVITSSGICYSFNIVDKNRFFRKHVHYYANFYHVRNDTRNFDGEFGYREGAGVNTFPRRALMSGVDNTLTITFGHHRNDTDFICNSWLHGYRIAIHSPASAPRLDRNFFWVPLNKVVLAAVEPKLVVTSEVVRKFDPDKRQCYLQNERYLKHFKIYTQTNCMLECVTNYTLKQCGCVDYYMPRDNTTAICGNGNNHCLIKAKNTVKIRELESKIYGKKMDTNCNCKPSCTELKYEVETSQSDIHFDEVKSRLELDILFEEYQFSQLKIYLKADQFITLERNELYGVSDLISNFGGLLGLFTGFSLISVAEIIYFITLRIFYNIRLYNSWSGPEN